MIPDTLYGTASATAKPDPSLPFSFMPHLFLPQIRRCRESGIPAPLCLDGMRNGICSVLARVIIVDDPEIEDGFSPFLAHRLSTWSYGKSVSDAWDIRYPILGLAIGRGIDSLARSFSDGLSVGEAKADLHKVLTFTTNIVIDRCSTSRDVLAIEILLLEIYVELIAVY